MKKNNNRITKIGNGMVDFYYSLQILTTLKPNELCNCINKRINNTLEDYNIAASEVLKEEIEKFILKEDCKELKVKVNLNKNINKTVKVKSNAIKPNINRIEVQTTQTGIKFFPIIDEQEQREKVDQMLEADYCLGLNIYGKSFVDNYVVLNLPAYKIQLENNSIVFIESVLYIFKNGMTILRIGIPIKNVDSTPLFDNNIGKYIKDIIDIYNIGNTMQQNSIETIKNAYCNYIYNSSKKIKSVMSLSEVLQNIILTDFNGIPSKIEDIPTDIEEELYKMIVAPIQIRNSISFKDIAKEYIRNNSNTYEGIKYITSSMGKCISIIDRDTMDYIISNEKMEIEDIDELYNLAIDMLRRNVEFTFIIILLKRMNDSFTYIKKEADFNNIKKVQREYNYNVIFILQLQQHCFGSVRDQLSFFENKMSYFLDNSNIKEKMNAIDSIIEDERATKNIRFQNFLSIGGVLLTIIFGLPAIHDTVTILRNSNIFIREDVPNVTIESCSIIIWIILSILVWIIASRKKIKDKK